MQDSIMKQDALGARQSIVRPPDTGGMLRREEWLQSARALLAQPGIRRGISVAAVSLGAYAGGWSGEAPRGYIVAGSVRQTAAALREAQQCGVRRLYVLLPAGGRDLAAMRLFGGVCLARAGGRVCYGVSESRELPGALQANFMELLLRIAEVRLANKAKRGPLL